MDVFDFQSKRKCQILYKDGVLDAHIDGTSKPISANEISDLIPFVLDLKGISFVSLLIGAIPGEIDLPGSIPFGIAVGGTIHFNNMGETFYEFVDRTTYGPV